MCLSIKEVQDALEQVSAELASTAAGDLEVCGKACVCLLFSDALDGEEAATCNLNSNAA